MSDKSAPRMQEQVIDDMYVHTLGLRSGMCNRRSDIISLSVRFVRLSASYNSPLVHTVHACRTALVDTPRHAGP